MVGNKPLSFDLPYTLPSEEFVAPTNSVRNNRIFADMLHRIQKIGNKVISNHSKCTV